MFSQKTKSEYSSLFLPIRVRLGCLFMISFFRKNIGLGDRHPSNLLLDRMSGKILHIDFGDCFEVAMTREKVKNLIDLTKQSSEKARSDK